MELFVNIFLSIAAVVAVAFLGYTTIRIFIEILKSNKPQPKEPKKEEPVVVKVVSEPKPEPQPKPEPFVMPEIVEHIDAEEADAMITDSVAMEAANYEKGAGHGKWGIINIGLIDENFNPNDVVTLAVLQQKGLVPKGIGRLKILADGELNKPLTIKSENYSVQAIKMIELTGGTVIILKD